MEIKLLKENDPLLRNACTAWEFDKDGDISNVIKEMTKIMFENNGIGLAAPQCGLMKRLFIMGNKDKLFACINPEIINGDGEEKDLEGCLSFPKLWLKVKRFKIIKVKYQVVTGETVEEEMSGLLARVFQHELDHLNGVCFDTKVGPAALDLAKERRRRKN